MNTINFTYENEHRFNLYFDGINIGKVGDLPFFIDGHQFNNDITPKYLTPSIRNASYLVVNVEKLYDEFFYEVCNILKKRNEEIGIIIISKEEHFTVNDWEKIYKLDDLNFKKSEIILISAELTDGVFGEYNHLPSRLIFGQFLHKDRTLIPDLFFKNNKEITRNKKILSSARKFNPVREDFYKSFKESYSHLQNSDTSFRYYGLRPNCNTELDTYGNLHTEFMEYNHSHKEVSTHSMMWEEETFYNTLMEEYSQYYFSVVHETLPKSSFSYESLYINPNGLYPNYPSKLQAGEKVLLPMATKGIFFVSSLPNIEKELNRIGVETFENIFGISYDGLEYTEKNKKILEICDIINSMSYSDIEDLYNSHSIQQKIKSNYEFVLYWKNQENIRNEYLKEIHILLDKK